MAEPRTITTTCPNCGASFDLSSETIGQKGRCQSCQTKFLIEETKVYFPEPEEEPEPAAKPVAAAPKRKPANPTPQPQLKSAKSSNKFTTFLLALVAGGLGYYIYTEQQTSTPAQPAKAPAKDLAEFQKSPASSQAAANNKAAQDKGSGKSKQASTPSGIAKKSSSATPKKKPAATDSAPALPALSETFPVKTSFDHVDIRRFRKTYPNVHQGYLPTPKEAANEAKNWGHYLGPLGVRIRSHVPQRQNRAAFAAIVPHSIRTATGQLGLTAAEIVQIAPGSPAEGNLKIGDLIIGIEGETLVSGNKYRPEWEFMHKDARELQLMLGEKIDQAQGRGDIRLSVLRYASERKTVFTQDLSAQDGRVVTKKIPVQPGQKIHLIVDPNGHNEQDHLSWLTPRLTGGDKVLDLTDKAQLAPDSATTGWGEIAYNKDLKGKSLGKNGITVHAQSTIVFTVPEGYDTFQTALKVTAAKGDLTASIDLVTPQQHLPVYKKELWKGKGGNQSIGVQPFDVAIADNGTLTLESHHFDGSIGGDGSLWLDVTLEGDYGTKKLFDLPWESAAAGYGRASYEENKEWKGKTYDKVLYLHAHGTAVWNLPAGTKRVKGYFSGGSHGKVQPIVSHTNPAYPLTGIHKDKVVELRFPIGKTGSFSDTYPKDCPKSEQMAKRHTEWLAVQQRDNGSWPRLAGYTSDGWDTGWCGLALLSSGDSKYDAQIRKAAYYLAYETTPSEWTAERAIRLIFLSEYYLRTKDAAIVAAIQAAYNQLADTCKTDFMAGHKVNGFGYGIAGQHYGTGNLALGMALASRTPITIDQDLVDGVIRHAGEVCVNGTYAYGRGRRFARDESRRHGGGNAMVGPGMLGAMIAGGHQSSITEVLERWDASIGDADNSHASPLLALFWASLAMAAEDESLFQKNMQNFKYRMTIDDCWEGGIVRSAFPLDYSTGDGVTAPMIHCAGTILMLNAPKHNLVITGNRDYFEKERIKTDAVSEWGAQVHSYYLRNWCLAQELLGRRAPKGIAKGISELKALPRTMELVPNTNKLVQKMAPAVIAQIAKDRGLSGTKKAYAIELLCGLDFQIRSTQKDKNQEVELVINQPFHQLNWLEKDKKPHFENSPLPLEATVKIRGKNLSDTIEFSTNGLDKFNLDHGTRKFRTTKPLRNASKPEFTGDAEISFTLGKTKVKYKRPLSFNSKLTARRGGGDKANLRRLQLKLRVAPRAYYQSQPLMIAGIPFDCMYLTERMVEVIPPKKGVINIHEGDTVTVDLASENLICPWVYSLEFDKMTQVKIAKPRKIREIRGTIEGDLKNLEDFDYDTYCEIKHQDGKSIIEYDFGKEIALNGLDANYRHGCFMRVWFKDGDTWKPIVWDTYSPDTAHNPRFADTKAKLWRVEIRHGRGKRFHTLRFYHNPNRINEYKQAPHIKDRTLFPADLEPN